MNTDFYAFGEILWDCLPSGRHPGGAPFNVTAHLVQLGASASLVSAIGRDSLGVELLSEVKAKGVYAGHVKLAGGGLPTGTVNVTLDGNSNATYEIVEPVAWDGIDVTEEVVAGVRQSRAVVFGSLAARSAHNRGQLDRLLAVEGPVKFFDVNLRPPFVDLPLLIDLARHADVLKLNDEELGMLAAWRPGGGAGPSEKPTEVDALAEACGILADATGVSRVCVTRGSEGAALWSDGDLVCVPAPAVVVKDTVGAGDAFMAGLAFGLIREMETRTVLENACEVGAYVASQSGATPRLPADIVERFAPR